MAAFIRSVLALVNLEIARVLAPQAIEQVCRELKHTWRSCTFDPATTVYACLRQILEGNPSCDHVPHLTGLAVTGEADCQARSRLPVELFHRLMAIVCDAVETSCDAAALWRGHRLWHRYGSSCSMPETPELQERFGQSSNQAVGCGFPTAHLMTLFHAATGCLLRITMAPLRSHGLPRSLSTHGALRSGDIVVADRGFCSFVHLAMRQFLGVFGLFRLPQRTIVSFRKGRGYATARTGKKLTGKKLARVAKGKPTSRWVKWLGTGDQIVEYFTPKQRPAWITVEDYALPPESILVRELRYRVAQKGYRVKEI